MNLLSLTSDQKKLLVTRSGMKVKIIDIFADGSVLVKVNGLESYRVTSSGRYLISGKESDLDIVIGQAKRRIRIYLYEDGTATWRDENLRYPPSKKKALKQTIFMEI